MNKIIKFLILPFLVNILTISSFAQLRGDFIIGQDDHIYFVATNTTGYNFYIHVSAISIDNTTSPTETIQVGEGFYLGPSTPWKWYWRKGDKILVTYPNGQSVYWICPYTDKVYKQNNNVTFKRDSSDGYIYQGSNISLTRVQSKRKDSFPHYKKGGYHYVKYGGSYIKVSGVGKFVWIGNVHYFAL